MTKKAQEAYIRGFCKAADAYGKDPRELIKVARLAEKYLVKNIIGNTMRASRVSPEVAAKSSKLLPYDRLQALRERLEERWNFLTDASTALRAHYIGDPPEIFREAIQAGHRMAARSASLAKFHKIQDRMLKMRKERPGSAATEMIFGRQ